MQLPKRLNLSFHVLFCWSFLGMCRQLLSQWFSQKLKTWRCLGEPPVLGNLIRFHLTSAGSTALLTRVKILVSNGRWRTIPSREVESTSTESLLGVRSILYLVVLLLSLFLFATTVLDFTTVLFQKQNMLEMFRVSLKRPWNATQRFDSTVEFVSVYLNDANNLLRCVLEDFSSGPKMFDFGSSELWREWTARLKPAQLYLSK